MACALEDGAQMVRYLWQNLEAYHENFILHHVTAAIQCDSKSLLQLQGEILLLLKTGGKTGKEIFAKKLCELLLFSLACHLNS